MSVSFPSSIDFQARCSTTSISQLDQVLSALWHNAFMSGEWASILTTQDLIQATIAAINLNISMLESVKQ